MELTRYFIKWEAYYQRIKAQDPDRLDHRDWLSYTGYLEVLNDDELFALLEDLLARPDHPAVRTIIQALTGTALDVDDMAFDCLMTTPADIIRLRMSTALDEIFSRALNANYVDNQEVINKIKAITVRNKAGPSEGKLLDLLELAPRLPVDLRIELLQLLAKIESEEADYSFWTKQMNRIAHEPYIGAAIIEGLKKDHTADALAVLRIYNDLPYVPHPENELPYFANSVESVMYRLLRRVEIDKILLFDDIRKQIRSGWARQLIDRIIQRPHFRDIREKMEAVWPNSPIVYETMAAHEMPDFVPEQTTDRLNLIREFYEGLEKRMS